jgi:Holliday junction resolvasome RuvABC ATP-dependent DNA helicase subunit
MNETDQILERFITDYCSREVPPPHILLTGPDSALNESIAKNFAARLGVEFEARDAAALGIVGDLTAILWGKRVAFIGNIHLLKKPLLEKIVQNVFSGEWEIVIGHGPAARTHRMDLSGLTLIATVPAKYDYPAVLLKKFETVLPVQSLTNDGLASVLAEEAWKGHIALDADATQLLVRCCGGRSDTLLSQFRRICGVIEQIKKTNRPQLTRQEVADALERLRIRVPSLASDSTTFDIHTLSGQEFEVMIKALLLEMGFEAELTEVTGDGGIDIIAKLDEPFVGGRYLLQCKRYSENNLVGAPEVRDFYGAVMADRAMKGIFITTSDFTAQAREFAAQSGIELVNFPKLKQLFEENGLARYA